MPVNKMNTLLIGDVYGDSGCRVLSFNLETLKKEFNADFVIVNAENAEGGFGLSAEKMKMLFDCGANVLTSGNHIWQNEEIIPFLDSEERLLRPANYGDLVQGHGSVVLENVAVINIQGRKNMPLTDNPFSWAETLVERCGQVKNIFVDFHAEDAEEKEAMAFFLDGKVTAVAGTHSHIQTADEKILPKGTAYITDLGMTGAENSVIGSKPEVSVWRQKSQLPVKAVPSDGEAVIQGVLVVSDADTGKALEIQRFTVKEQK